MLPTEPRETKATPSTPPARRPCPPSTLSAPAGSTRPPMTYRSEVGLQTSDIQLEQVLGHRQILQPVVTEITHRVPSPSPADTSRAVASDMTTCPPCAAPAILAARCTSMPTFSAVVNRRNAGINPIRLAPLPGGQSKRPIPVALERRPPPLPARSRTRRRNCPSVPIIVPPWSPQAARRIRRCASNASAYAGPNRDNSRVEPSMSENTRDTVPDGRSRMSAVTRSRSPLPTAPRATHPRAPARCADHPPLRRSRWTSVGTTLDKPPRSSTPSAPGQDPRTAEICISQSYARGAGARSRSTSPSRATFAIR